MMFIQIVNGANLQPTSFDEGRHDCVDLGTIIDKGGDQFTINQGLANVFRSQPPVSGIFVPVATGSIMRGSQCWAGAGGALEMWPPFILVDPILVLRLLFPQLGLPFIFQVQSQPESRFQRLLAILPWVAQVHLSCNTFRRKLHAHQPSWSLRHDTTCLA